MIRSRPAAVRAFMRLSFFQVALALVLFFTGCGMTRLPAGYRFSDSQIQEIEAGISEVLDHPDFRNAFWGAKVVDVASGQVLYERNADRYFVPASNAKLYTSAAALDQLGPDYRFVTRVFTTGQVQDSTLHGDLIVIGSGDPTISGKFTDGDRTWLFRTWADSLKARGIFRIDGDIVGDDDLFDDETVGAGWQIDDEVYWYSARIGALSFNDNCIDLEARASDVGQPATVTWEPDETPYVEIVNRTTTIDRDSTLKEGYERQRASDRFVISSRIPQGETDFESLAVENPTTYFVHVLKETLEAEGIAVSGVPMDIDDLTSSGSLAAPSSSHLLALHESVPLSDIAAVINKPSHNLYAEQVLRTLGVERPVNDSLITPGSAAMGVGAMLRTLDASGIDTSDVSIADGSGLSRYNLISPAMTVALLRYMWSHPDPGVRRAFLDSLPVGGRDGTLRYRYVASPLRDRVRAKTGTMQHVSSLSGYVELADGSEFVFSLMCNNFTAPTGVVRDAQDRIVERLGQRQP